MRALLALVLLATLGACRDTRIRPGGCSEDKDCGPAEAFRCETRTGECYCKTNAACPTGQFCNERGFCQSRAGCQTNAECQAGTFCDTTTGACIPSGRCTSDLHCALGQVCVENRCVAGCHGSGDCASGACRCGDQACRCTGTTPAEVERCPVGTCDEQFCGTTQDCRFGEICMVPDAGPRSPADGGLVDGGSSDAGAPRAICQSDYDDRQRPYCARCVSGAGISTCGVGANFCIIDTRTSATYCGADCSEGQQCPRGYGCRDIRIVYSRWMCGDGLTCPGDPTLPCTEDTDCKRGGKCLKLPGASNGTCAGQCWRREGSSFGYCTCQQDLDCPQQACSQGECTVSRKKCVQDDDCRQIRCVDFEGVGACLIGQNCTPANGLTCVEVQ